MELKKNNEKKLLNEVKSNILKKDVEDTKKNQEFTKNLYNQLQLSDLPDNVSISTMTICCKTDTLYHITDIKKYIELSVDGIICCGSDPDTQRSLIMPKKKNGKRKKKKNFYNQITLRIVTDEKIINVKLFTNGSIQMTGCKTIISTQQALERLFIKLHEKKKIIDENGIEQTITFISEPQNVKINMIYDVKISMINSNFKIGYKIKREKLYEILVQENKKCTYDPIIHACVNIKHRFDESKQDDKEISIFVFESGSIIITGARNCTHINSAYNYINTFLIKYLVDIKKQTFSLTDEDNSIYGINLLHSLGYRS